MVRVGILDRVPERIREFLVEEEKAVVLVPRFDGSLGRWLTRRLTNPCYRVRLDRLGTEVWNLCDGSRTVGDIAAELRRRLGPDVEPAEERVAGYIQRLDRGRCIRLSKGRR
jgi:hypothetical protein